MSIITHIVDQLFSILAHEYVVWLNYYYQLELVCTKNIKSYETFHNSLIEMIENKKKYLTYEDCSDFEELLKLIKIFEYSFLCSFDFHRKVFMYINEIVTIVRNIPKYVSCISINKTPDPSYQQYSDLIIKCRELKSKIFSMNKQHDVK